MKVKLSKQEWNTNKIEGDGLYYMVVWQKASVTGWKKKGVRGPGAVEQWRSRVRAPLLHLSSKETKCFFFAHS